MHLLVPFAADSSEACGQVLRDLRLPRLERLLKRLSPAARDEGEASSCSPPQERALARAYGWRGGDGTLPFAALAAGGDGVATGGMAWGLLTPAHWQLGRDHVVMLDPEQLSLGETESRALFASLRGLLADSGFEHAWGAAGRWYLGRGDLDGFATASLDRVIGRSVDGWQHAPPSLEGSAALGRELRRLQSEAQLLFHDHPVNEAREERGAATVNSFWLSGCGPAQPIAPPAGTTVPEVEGGLRSPLLAGDWAAWAEAWQALDAGPLARLLAAVEAGEPVRLTLCGERSAATFEAQPRALVERLRGVWRKAEPHTLLAGL